MREQCYCVDFRGKNAGHAPWPATIPAKDATEMMRNMFSLSPPARKHSRHTCRPVSVGRAFGQICILPPQAPGLLRS